MKGIFYSVIVIMLIAPIIMYIILYLSMTESQLEEISTKIKGDRLVGYARSIEQDLPRVLEITSRVAMGAAVSYIDINGIALENSDERLVEIMKNGTIYGSEFELLDSDSLKDWIESIETKGNDYGLDTNITISSLSIKPYDSFNLLLSAIVSVNITDNRAMKIYRIYNESRMISIEGFEDPLYGLETNGLLKRKFTSRQIIDNVTKLDQAIANEFYTNSTDGASFLDRLEGRLTVSNKYKAMTQNQIGLETIVYLPDLSAIGLPIKSDQSNVDYLYFNTTIYSGYPVNNSVYGWLKIDDEHANTYSIELIK